MVGSTSAWGTEYGTGMVSSWYQYRTAGGALRDWEIPIIVSCCGCAERTPTSFSWIGCSPKPVPGPVKLATPPRNIVHGHDGVVSNLRSAAAPVCEQRPPRTESVACGGMFMQDMHEMYSVLYRPSTPQYCFFLTPPNFAALA